MHIHDQLNQDPKQFLVVPSIDSSRFSCRGATPTAVSVFPAEGGFRKFSTATVMLLFKAWVFSPTSKEVGKGCLQVSKTLLKGNTANTIEKVQILLCFPTSQHGGCFSIANPLLMLIPSFGTNSQGHVVD
jgi:hypothetical protein